MDGEGRGESDGDIGGLVEDYLIVGGYCICCN